MSRGFYRPRNIPVRREPPPRPPTPPAGRHFNSRSGCRAQLHIGDGGIGWRIGACLAQLVVPVFRVCLRPAALSRPVPLPHSRVDRVDDGAGDVGRGAFLRRLRQPVGQFGLAPRTPASPLPLRPVVTLGAGVGDRLRSPGGRGPRGLSAIPRGGRVTGFVMAARPALDQRDQCLVLGVMPCRVTVCTDPLVEVQRSI